MTIYDETIEIFDQAVHQSRLGDKDKSDALKNLSKIAQEMERGFTPNNNFDAIIQKERDESYLYRGKTVFGDAKKPDKPKGNIQLNLFD